MDDNVAGAIEILKDYYSENANSEIWNKNRYLSESLKILIDYVERQQKVNDAVFDASRIISRN